MTTAKALWLWFRGLSPLSKTALVVVVFVFGVAVVLESSTPSRKAQRLKEPEEFDELKLMGCTPPPVEKGPSASWDCPDSKTKEQTLITSDAWAYYIRSNPNCEGGDATWEGWAARCKSRRAELLNLRKRIVGPPSREDHCVEVARSNAGHAYEACMRGELVGRDLGAAIRIENCQRMFNQVERALGMDAAAARYASCINDISRNPARNR